MNLTNNSIKIKVEQINEEIYLLIHDLTLVIVQIDLNMYNNLNTEKHIEYRDVCNIIKCNVSKVIGNEIKLKALISFIKKNTNYFTLDLFNSLKKFQEDSTNTKKDNISKTELKLRKILSNKLNETEKRYQDRRRVERMIKEFRYYLLEEHNNKVILKQDLKLTTLSNKEKYLASLIKLDLENQIPIPLPRRGICYVKEKNLYKSKYTKRLSSEELIYLIYKSLNRYMSTPIEYSKLINYISPHSRIVKVKKNIN